MNGLRAGAPVPNRGLRPSTVLPDMDFETYSEAGYKWDEKGQKWTSLPDTSDRGIKAVGASVYTEHESADIISLAYDLKDGKGARLWVPVCPPPTDLLEYIAAGGIIEAHNSAFEFYVWNNIGVRRYGWPKLESFQLRDSAAKCAAWSIPVALGKAGSVLGVEDEKIEDGKRLIKKFSIPRTPTKNDPRRRILPEEDPIDSSKFYAYNIGDIVTESQVSAAVPDLLPDELDLWLADQRINFRGIQIDTEAVEKCIELVKYEHAILTAELVEITGGDVKTASQVARMLEWLKPYGVNVPDLKSETVSKLLKNAEKYHPNAVRVLQIRDVLSAASVKKLFALRNRTSRDGRLRGLFAFCGADRTGRWAGRGAQPQNLPNSGPQVDGEEWGIKHVNTFLDSVKYRSPETLRAEWGNLLEPIAGSLRGLFTAAAGHDLICSDYSAIEAVVLAALAGEEWRLEVFRTHGKIYEMSAAKITGIPFEEFERHKEETGDHHPMRKKIGKVAELASGYQGGLGAWKAFGADKHLSETEIRDAIKAWRKESPAIASFWYRIEETAVAAVETPGVWLKYRGLELGTFGDVLYIKLLSGRTLNYHRPRLVPDETPWGAPVKKLTFEGVDSLTKKWTRMTTYGGKLTENVTQATARDIMANAILNCERNGYPIVLHVHDEAIAEVPEGVGSVEEFETLMATLPDWCSDWPIRAAGGWRGKRYRKD